MVTWASAEPAAAVERGQHLRVHQEHGQEDGGEQGVHEPGHLDPLGADADEQDRAHQRQAQGRARPPGQVLTEGEGGDGGHQDGSQEHDEGDQPDGRPLEGGEEEDPVHGKGDPLQEGAARTVDDEASADLVGAQEEPEPEGDRGDGDPVGHDGEGREVDLAHDQPDGSPEGGAARDLELGAEAGAHVGTLRRPRTSAGVRSATGRWCSGRQDGWGGREPREGASTLGKALVAMHWRES